MNMIGVIITAILLIMVGYLAVVRTGVSGQEGKRDWARGNEGKRGSGQDWKKGGGENGDVSEVMADGTGWQEGRSLVSQKTLNARGWVLVRAERMLM